MQVMMVVEAKMGPVPGSIEVLENWGYVGVVDSTGSFLYDGDHMFLEGTEEAFMQWFEQYNQVWIQKPGTSPMQQAFEAWEFRSNNAS